MKLTSLSASLCAMLLCLLPVPASAAKLPDGISQSDWSSIREAYEAGQHSFQPTEYGWQARNPRQQWTTRFDKRGFLATPQDGAWTWGLELRSYGFGEMQTTICGTPEVKADGQRLSYQWDDCVMEWFVNDQRGSRAAPCKLQPRRSSAVTLSPASRNPLAWMASLIEQNGVPP